MGLFIGKVCSIERVTKDNTIRFTATYYKQLLTAVIFAALFISQGQKTCGQKMMMNDKTKNE